MGLRQEKQCEIKLRTNSRLGSAFSTVSNKGLVVLATTVLKLREKDQMEKFLEAVVLSRLLSIETGDTSVLFSKSDETLLSCTLSEGWLN